MIVKWLIYLFLGIAAVFLLVGLALLFTIFWLFIGIPFIIIGAIIALIVWIWFKLQMRKIRKRK